MIKPCLATALLILTACDTPTIGFKHTASRDIRIGANTFTVFFNESEAQAIRLNNATLGGLKQATTDGHTAIESATGCRVTKLHPKSDPVLTRANIKC